MLSVILPNLVLFVVMAAVVVGLVFALVARGGRRSGPQLPPPPPSGNSATTELDMRYARGEMNRDEYLQRRDDLLRIPRG